MYVVVSGAGEVGYHVARALRLEGHNVAVIDRDAQAIERARELDVLVVEGNGASPETLDEAKIRKADLFIGATGDDEANMLGCALAKSVGVPTIARINDPSYLDESTSTKYKKIGIDVAVCPELVAAIKIANLLRAPAMASANIFAHGHVALVESKVAHDAPVAGKPIKVVKPPPGVQLVAIFRGEDIIIPRGEDILHEGDRVYLIVVSPEALKEAEVALGLKPGDHTGRVERLVIAGATRIGIRLAELLENKVKVTLIEKEKAAGDRAFERLKKTLVIHGDATDLRLIAEENIGEADAFVGAARTEEYNILACLLAKQLGVRRVVAFINQPELKPLAESIGVNLAVAPRQATVSSLLKWTYGMDAVDMAVVAHDEARLLEVKIKPSSPLRGKPLKKIPFPQQSIVGAILRDGNILLPRGDDTIEAGDEVIIFALHDAVPKIEKLLRK